VRKLYRLVESGGPKPSHAYQTQVVLPQDEAPDPEIEGRTMEWTLRQDRFGRCLRINETADGGRLHSKAQP